MCYKELVDHKQLPEGMLKIFLYVCNTGPRILEEMRAYTIIYSSVLYYFVFAISSY